MTVVWDPCPLAQSSFWGLTLLKAVSCSLALTSLQWTEKAAWGLYNLFYWNCSPRPSENKVSLWPLWAGVWGFSVPVCSVGASGSPTFHNYQLTLGFSLLDSHPIGSQLSFSSFDDAPASIFWKGFCKSWAQPTAPGVNQNVFRWQTPHFSGLGRGLRGQAG